jgi:hypothetical protein
MPSAVRVGKSELFVTVRCREGDDSWIDAYRSLDDGRTWKFDNKAVPTTGEGNPPSMIKLADGRICLTYGVRAAPYEMRARLSDDGGRTWGKEIVLRGNGGGRDVGYPASIQLPNGNVVTTYYFHNTLLGDRFVAATIWNPGLVQKK